MFQFILRGNRNEKKLYRSRKDKMLAGICGGLAEYFDVDPSLVRLASVLLCLYAGTGLLVYILAAIIIPEDPTY
ncbi:PspC domain-containing protein [Faecalibacillus faecis]|uniref:PspC domain-containing protein n=1 Tax=Faecalibacillus faecis TaxID=1982628 RepID=A0AAW4VPR7_9FIRM|nr:PspC domain-containing protein [Faecalibacillus faecis]MCB8569062.1 PspC domain-containing protein [Faecalibacillus faecis]MCB8611103.1 PspC domain-containing protein [Faecalibacillus faecis]MCQ5199604.1 PspC domain-containing protein [Faecalibacillus faecis]